MQVQWTRFHPVSRIVIGVATVLILASLAGVDRIGTALAYFSPAGSFEAQCEKLPASVLAVDVVPHRVIENRSTPFDALARLGEGRATSGERTIGLTLAKFGHRSTLELRGLQDARYARACIRPSVAVELFLEPVTVYVAREYADDPCRAQVIREHEERHVAVYTTFAQESAQRLRRHLASVVGTAPLYATSADNAREAVDRDLAAALDAFMRDAERTLAERQALIDTPEEYERVQTACR